MSENKKSYYAVIPATVRYDKKLTANAKLMYGEITALCNEKGYCWASNSYFAKLYGVSKQAISVWIKSLQNNGYVNIEYEREGKSITMRRVSINIDRVSIDVDGGINKSLIGYQQNLKGNNIYNTTFNNKESPKQETEEMSQALQLATLLLFESREHDKKLHIGMDKQVIARWAKDIEKLIRIDSRDYSEIERVIRWVKTEGNFWLPNIMSGKKLREKFPQLVLQAENSRKAHKDYNDQEAIDCWG